MQSGFFDAVNVFWNAQDYTQYYLDLETSNSHEAADWKFLYSAKSEYQIDDISPSSMNQLAMKLKSADPQCDLETKPCECNKILQRYSQLNTAKYNLKHCDWRCQRNHVCAIMRVNASEHKECIAIWNGAGILLLRPTLLEASFLAVMLGFFIERFLYS